MAKINIILDTRKARKDGTYPLKFSIFLSQAKRMQFSVGIFLKEDQWNGKFVIRTPRKDALNSALRYKVGAADDELLRLDMSGATSRLSAKQIKTRILAAMGDAPVDDSLSEIIGSAFIAFIESAKAERTKDIYRQTLRKLATKYNTDSLTFADITPRWLREWENDMRSSGLSANAISVHMRNVRAIFNRAIDDDVISQDLYPFRKFKIKSEKTPKRALSIDELRELMTYPCEDHLCKYRDYFMLIFYLIGINLVDLACLSEIKDGRVSYRRSKTGRLYSVKIEPEAMSIIERYRGSGNLLDIMDHNVDYHNFLARMNEGLKKIGSVTYVANRAKDPKLVKKNKKSITPRFPDLSGYWARHTWATIAASLDIPKETIAAALGHGQNSVTDIYIDFDQNKVDVANRQVIDYVNKKESPK